MSTSIDISIIVPLKNRIELTRRFYNYFRSLYSDVEICFASHGSTDGTHQWLDQLYDPNVCSWYDDKPATLSDSINRAVALSTRDYICFLHNDMVVHPNFLESFKQTLEYYSCVAYKVVEPNKSTFSPRVGKIEKNFGYGFEDFDNNKFLEWVNQQKPIFSEPAQEFCQVIKKKIFQQIGGFDNLFNPVFCEDGDYLTRLDGINIKQVFAPKAYAYHFGSLTIREPNTYKESADVISQRSQRNYLRKWGHLGVDFHQGTREIGLIANDIDVQNLWYIEPYFSYIRCNVDPHQYIKAEQPFTKFNLLKKFDRSFLDICDIICEIESTDSSLHGLVAKLNQKLQQLTKRGTYQYGPFKVTARCLNTYQHKLLKLDNPYYQEKLN